MFLFTADNDVFLFTADKSDPGKKKGRKTTKAGGSGIDLAKIAQEQQEKLQKDREERIEAVKAAKEAPADDGSGSGSGSGSGGVGVGDLKASVAIPEPVAPPIPEPVKGKTFFNDKNRLAITVTRYNTVKQRICSFTILNLCVIHVLLYSLPDPLLIPYLLKQSYVCGNQHVYVWRLLIGHSHKDDSAVGLVSESQVGDSAVGKMIETVFMAACVPSLLNHKSHLKNDGFSCCGQRFMTLYSAIVE